MPIIFISSGRFFRRRSSCNFRFSETNGGWNIHEHEMLVHLYEIYPTDLRKRRTYIYNHFHRYCPHYSRQDMVIRSSIYLISSHMHLSS